MSEPHQRRSDRIADAAYLAGIETKPVAELRAMHEECLEVETELSYVRRLAQARVDIVGAELDRRASGGSIEDLVAALPQILADPGPRPDPASSRLTRHLAPAPAIEFRRGLENLIGDDTLANLPVVPDDELRATRERLLELERDVSGRRRALHRVIERVERALAERLRDGDA